MKIFLKKVFWTKTIKSSLSCFFWNPFLDTPSKIHIIPIPRQGESVLRTSQILLCMPERLPRTKSSVECSLCPSETALIAVLRRGISKYYAFACKNSALELESIFKRWFRFCCNSFKSSEINWELIINSVNHVFLLVIALNLCQDDNQRSWSVSLMSIANIRIEAERERISLRVNQLICSHLICIFSNMIISSSFTSKAIFPLKLRMRYIQYVEIQSKNIPP